jgi:hypothetical protein
MKPDLRAAVVGIALLLAPVGVEAATHIRLDLPEDHSRLVVKAMKQELARIISDADIELHWKSSASAPEEVDGRIFSVALSGSCVGMARETRETGPLGWTQVVDGRVLPYIEIDCHRVRSLLTPQWSQASEVRRELYLGKALARVLAHELVHAMTRTLHHGDEGLRKWALSPMDLMRGKYKLSHSDFEDQTHLQLAAAARVRDAVGD